LIYISDITPTLCEVQIKLFISFPKIDLLYKKLMHYLNICLIKVYIFQLICEYVLKCRAVYSVRFEVFTVMKTRVVCWEL